METKQCTKCKEIKNIDEFYKGKEGYRFWCKLCQSIAGKEYRLKYPNKNKENKLKNKERNQIVNKQYYNLHKDEIIAKSGNWRINNPEKMEISRKKWKDNNPELFILTSRKAGKKYYASLKGRIHKNISSLIKLALKNNKNGWSWETLLGYTVEDLKKHLESLFTEGMTWENYGFKGWHIDHIIPKGLWEFTKPTDREFKQCWALANLQPLWAIDNLKKSKKFLK